MGGDGLVAVATGTERVGNAVRKVGRRGSVGEGELKVLSRLGFFFSAWLGSFLSRSISRGKLAWRLG